MRASRTGEMGAMDLERVWQLQGRKLVRFAVAIGLAGWAGCIAGAILESDAFYRAYLFSYVFWMQFPVGAMALLAIHHLTGGQWGWVAIRPLRAAVLTLPVLVILFAPIGAGIGALYPWTRPSALALSEHGGHFKEAYLMPWPFWVRTAFYLLSWLVLGWFLLRLHGRAARRWSSFTLIMLGITITFSSIDWVMSIEPEWRSTSYGPIFMLSEALSAMSLAVFTFSLFPERLGRTREAKPLNDSGNLLLVCLLGWIYLAFMQYLIMWSANLPDEVTWYINRTQAGWKWLLVSIVIFSVGLPFVALLFRSIKSQAARLGALGGVLVIFRIVWAYWYVMPAYHPEGFWIGWVDFAAFFGMGGLWSAVYLWALFSPRTYALIEGEEAAVADLEVKRSPALQASR